jgi:hypothetical protein
VTGETADAIGTFDTDVTFQSGGAAVVDASSSDDALERRVAALPSSADRDASHRSRIGRVAPAAVRAGIVVERQLAGAVEIDARTASHAGDRAEEIGSAELSDARLVVLSIRAALPRAAVLGDAVEAFGAGETDMARIAVGAHACNHASALRYVEQLVL